MANVLRKTAKYIRQQQRECVPIPVTISKSATKRILSLFDLQKDANVGFNMFRQPIQIAYARSGNWSDLIFCTRIYVSSGAC